MAITENGKRFVQEVDVDEREEIEVFRVPSHNDVERASFYHDFKMVSVLSTTVVLLAIYTLTHIREKIT